MIETRLLQYFLALAREQSITKAAETLHISQPSLSKQLMELERQLGKPLFIRGKKNITLTTEGILLRDHAIRILDLLELTELMLTTDESFLDGDIHLGYGEISIPDSVLALFGRFRQAHPRCRLHVQMESASLLTELLHSGQLDMALIFEPATHTQFHCFPLPIQDQWGLLMPEDSPLAKSDRVTFSDMRQIPLIYPQRIYNNRQHPSGFTLDNSELNIAATYNQTAAAVQMTARGLGYAYCLKQEALSGSPEGLTFRPLKPAFFSTLYLLLRKDVALSPAASAFLELLLYTAGKEES